MEYTKRNSGGDAGNAKQGSPDELLSWIIKSHNNMTKANPVLVDKLRKKNNKSKTGDAE